MHCHNLWWDEQFSLTWVLICYIVASANTGLQVFSSSSWGANQFVFISLVTFGAVYLAVNEMTGTLWGGWGKITTNENQKDRKWLIIWKVEAR